MIPEFIYKHNQTVIGALVAFILLTGIFFLWRMINEEKATESASPGLDVQALEKTLKRVLDQSSNASAGGRAMGATADGGDDGANRSSGSAPKGEVDDKAGALLAEREKKIVELQLALEQAKAQVAEQANKPESAPGVGADGAVAMLEMQNKVRELEARLAEYSIIEDDIADLSLYKEENQRLKAELEQARAGGAAAATAGGEASPKPTPSSSEMTSPGLPLEKADKFGIDQDDDVMKEFAAAVNGHATPAPDAATTVPAPAADDPMAALSATFDLKGEHEPLKSAEVDSQAAVDAMLNAAEAGSTVLPDQDLAASANDSSPLNPSAESAPSAAAPPDVAQAKSSESEDPLSGALDTSKMLAEVASLDQVGASAGGESPEASLSDALDGALDTDKLLMEVSELGAGEDLTPGEDLFGEFKDEEKKG